MMISSKGTAMSSMDNLTRIGSLQLPRFQPRKLPS
jgi:hypothetical protein